MSKFRAFWLTGGFLLLLFLTSCAAPVATTISAPIVKEPHRLSAPAAVERGRLKDIPSKEEVEATRKAFEDAERAARARVRKKPDPAAVERLRDADDQASAAVIAAAHRKDKIIPALRAITSLRALGSPDTKPQPVHPTQGAVP